MKRRKFISKNASTILIILSAISFIGTIILSIDETKKAEKKIKSKEEEENRELTKTEKIKESIPVYIPMIGTGIMSLSCMFCAGILDKKKQASLTSSLALIEKGYFDYRNKNRELFGEEVDRKVLEEIQKSKVERKKDILITQTTMFEETGLDFYSEEREEKKTFYDSFSNRYFDSTINKVLQAEYHINRNFQLSGIVSVNEFYDFLGIPGIENGDDIVWDAVQFESDGFYWIDFNHSAVHVDSDMEILVIDMITPPKIEED